MTKEEYSDAAALVVRLRKELEDATQDLSLHYDALKQSNAQCGKLLVQNEQLTAELDRMKGDPLPIKLVGKLKDAEDSNKTLHSELVEVRAALAATTEQRDSLRRTLDEWERADTEPHERIEPPTISDDLEFRAGIPTPAMLAVCSWWEVQGRGDVICFKNKDQRPVVWRSLRGDASWQYEDCPQPLKPSKRTWKQLDLLLATAAHDVADHVVPPVLPLCNVCHGCGHTLSRIRTHAECLNEECDLDSTYGPSDISPYYGPCRSTQQVRHE